MSPFGEIEGIVTFLLVEMGCHVCIKLNPTLLGKDEVGHLLLWHNEFEPVEDWSGKVEEPILRTELRGVLRAAVDALPPDYRTAFLLHDVDGMPNREIARSLGISLPAVKSRVHRSRLFLRQRLGRYLTVA